MNGLTDFNIEDITNITPVYDFKSNSEKGKFFVEIGEDGIFSVRFGTFLDHRLKIDQKENNGALFMYMMNHFSDKTVSHVIEDLYSCGFPVDDWVKDYIDHITKHDAKVSSMLALVSMLKNFGSDDDYNDPSGSWWNPYNPKSDL